MLLIGPLKLSSDVIQSPMAGCTDLAFRMIARDHGLGLAFTEMISAEALVRQHVKTRNLLKRAPDDHPTGCQIVGRNPASLAGAASILEPLGFDVLDINCGCPVRKITGQEAGSALMKDPERAEKIFRAVFRSLKKIPLTVKMRSGFTDATGKEAVELSRIAEGCGAAAVTIHGRTRAQGYSGKADWSVIEKVKRAVKIPVFGNGDIFHPEDAERMKSSTGCDGIAIGRGALGNPWLYEQITAFLKNKKNRTPSPSEVKQTAIKHLELTAHFDGPKVALLKSRHIACWYFKGFRGASKLRELINRSRSFDEVEEAIKAFEPLR